MSTKDSSKGMATVRPSNGQSSETSDESSHKKGGKKRKASELEEDKLLWAKLKTGVQISRNKRLREWKEKVASEYPGCEASSILLLFGRKNERLQCIITHKNAFQRIYEGER